MVVQLAYDRLVAERGVDVSTLPDAGPPLPGSGRPYYGGRTSPEVRERILAMFKGANSKYALPFEGDRLATMSLLGGNWQEYGAVVLQMATLDTLLSIEEKLDQLVSGERADVEAS
jgi:hypothetical protein